jgi:hypothetical protein
MAGLSFAHLLIFLPIVWIAWMVPLAILFGRIGRSRAWCLVAIVPPFAMIALWTIAFMRWNVDDASADRPL